MIGARIMSLRFKMSVGAGVLMVFFLLPAVGFAQQLAHSPSGLVPCGAVSGFLDIFGATECGLCDLVKLFGNINNFLLGVTIPISIALFAWAGVMYFAAGGNPKQIIRAHRIFKSVIIGFIIALSAWLVVQTVLNALVNRSIFTSGSWNTLQCAKDRERKRDSNVSDIFGFITGMQSGGGIQTGGQGPGQTGDIYSDQRARAALAAACSGSECFTYTSIGSCSDPNNSSCTSLDGVRQATVTRLTTLQSECGCTINISGGTETGHGTPGAGNVHTNGTAFDLSKNSNLDRVITNYPAVTPVSIGGGATAPAYRAPDGTLFINEGSHWHLQMQNRPI